ncbi:MAG: sialidase family protein [Planctomycetota bacterium]|jgi:sialidase-1|nr:sialidase family protein [Planctomycetota bacterium]
MKATISLLCGVFLMTMAGARAEDAAQTAAGHPAEGKLDTFLGETDLDIQQVFKGGRFPNVVVGVDGTVLAVFGGVKLRRSEDGGQTWGPEILVSKGFMCGGVTVNEKNGEVLAFVEKHHPPAPLTVLVSKDHGKSWSPVEVEIRPDANGNVPSMHMNEHGITLRHGEHAGRLLRASRHYAGRNHRSKWPEHYTNAVFSDDGGKIWQTSAPFPAKGTGEATIAELADGRIYYNSRRHWAPEGENPRRRWTAWSDDGGATWKGLSICEVLPDGPQNTNYGCMAGLVRLPIQGKDILLYSNCDSPGGRNRGTVWASFDGGKTWPLKRLVYKGGFAYSSITAGRPATKTEGWIYLHFESGGSRVARFNLSWVLKGENTGDGDLPGWLPQ